jgi:two-component system, LytTR family, response regulator
MLRALIIDDEKKARETICSILHLYCKDVLVVGEADSVKSGIELIQKEKPEIVFLDINLTDGSGFDILQKLSLINFKIIFITAYESYALKAFKFSALDYILKPVNPDDLIKAVEKAKLFQASDTANLKFEAFISNMENIVKEVKKIVLKTSESIHVINVNEIIRCEADRNYTSFFLISGKKILVSNTLKEYDEMLSSYQFFRPHQSHLVNINHITSYEKKDGGYLMMKDKSMVPVSVRKKETLLTLLEKI